MAKLRLGVLPLRVESGRYELPKVDHKNRICRQCTLEEVENEEHFLLRCTKHSTKRIALLSEINSAYWEQWDSKQKLIHLLNNPLSIKATAKFILDSFNARDTP